MKPIEIAKTLSFKVLSEGSAQRDVESVYCCDLLSLVMSRAKADCAWITVMCNINAVGVASLTDSACIVLSEGMEFDSQTLEKAVSEGICVLSTELDSFSAGKAIDALITK